jgi:hypothetical protein
MPDAERPGQFADTKWTRNQLCAASRSAEMGTGTSEDPGASPHFLEPHHNVCGFT